MPSFFKHKHEAIGQILQQRVLIIHGLQKKYLFLGPSRANMVVINYVIKHGGGGGGGGGVRGL